MSEPATKLPLVTTGFPTGKDTVSFTEVSDWLECSWRHRLKHIERLGIWVDTPYNIFGSAVHDVGQVYLETRKIDVDVGITYLKKNWTEGVERQRFYNREELRKKSLPEFGWWVETLKKIAADIPEFMDSTFPGWKFVAAEQGLNEPMAEHPGMSFKGFIDGVIAVPDKRGNTKYWVIDWKTAGWGWRKSKKADFTVQLQLRLYKIYWAQKAGVDLKDVRCAFVLLKRDENVKPGQRCELVPVSVGPTTKKRSLRMVDRMIKNVRKGVHIKNRHACMWCDFKNSERCPERRAW